MATSEVISKDIFEINKLDPVDIVYSNSRKTWTATDGQGEKYITNDLITWYPFKELAKLIRIKPVGMVVKK